MISKVHEPTAAPVVIHLLDHDRDRAAVSALMLACGDYTGMMRGTRPDPADADDFLLAAPPGRTARSVRKLGAFLPYGGNKEPEATSADGSALAAIADVVPNHPKARTWFVGLLLVHPDWRGRGVGMQFCDHIQTSARDAGAERLELLVLEENERARRFWARLGFVVTGRREPIRIGERWHGRYEMEKAVTA